MFAKKYDVLVVGCGLFGAVCARKAAEAGKKVLIVDKHPHIAGHIYTKEINSIQTHVYGPHYFNTNNKAVWDYVNRFAEFNQYRAKVNANYKGKVYSLPINLFTFSQLWGCTSPGEARQALESRKVKADNATNLEEWVLSQVGREIYEVFFKGYTTKQWGRPPKQIPIFVGQRIPIRFSYDNDYHEAEFAGVPAKGYTHLVGNIVDGIDIKLETDFFDFRDWRKVAHKLVYSGSIDRLFKYKYGALEYRTLKFKNNVVDGNFQGIGQMNYTDQDVPYTRIIEHKHFYGKPEKNPKSVITFEYPDIWDQDKTPYYPINDSLNNKLYKQYQEELQNFPDIVVGGRLGSYKYLDMDDVIVQALEQQI